MGLETRVRVATGAGAAYIRPWPISALAGLYIVVGIALVATGAAASFDAPHYPLGELLLPGTVARAFVLAFGAGLAGVGWGFLRLSRTAWVVFICAAWVGLVLEGLWCLLGLTRGAAGLQYVPLMIVDGALLAYVHGRRSIFFY